MKKKCDMCDQPATVHIIEVVNGQTVEKHLCEYHAAEAGMVQQQGVKPITQLVQQFMQPDQSPPPTIQTISEAKCPSCDLSFSQFRKQGTLGCPMCYETFENELIPLIRRAHESCDRHVGKTPTHSADDMVLHERLLSLRHQIEEAVRCEEYERAAQLRNELNAMDSGSEAE